jgi:putative lipoic acid-binding regulatory protein
MILDDKTQEKPKIVYPTNWGFKIIGRDKDALHQVIKDTMGDKEHECTYANTSKGGKFHSYNASCSVETQEERDRLFKAFQDHDDVQMVI